MQDAITNVINQSDVQGLYLDVSSMGRLEQYFASGELRVRAAATISANSAAIIKEAVAKSLLYSDITRPGGNMYTTRRYAACIRDLDYYLRYATYAMLAGDTSILDERVLNGLDTYCDLTELFIRYTMKDWVRVGVLLGRLPKFLVVERIRAIHEFETGKKPADFVASDLPERTPTEQIYKLMAQTHQNIDREKVALQLMSKALEIGARVGAKETFLRQDASLLNLVIRIAGEKPTVYLEDLASQITTRLKSRSENILGLSAALTKRELEILRHLATGKPISAIGTTLHISQNTMKTHLKNIYRKIGAGGRDEAVAKAKNLYLL